MKKMKLAGILSLALLAFSCEKGNDPKGFSEDLMTFTGEADVTAPSTEVTNKPNSVFTAEFDLDDKTVDIVMVEISFATGMPPQTMELDDVPYKEVNGKAVIDVASIVPEVGGLPYSSREIFNLKATISKEDMLVGFTCIGYGVVYNGSI